MSACPRTRQGAGQAKELTAEKVAVASGTAAERTGEAVHTANDMVRGRLGHH